MKQKLKASRSTLAKVIYLVVILSLLLALYVIYDEWNLRGDIDVIQAQNTELKLDIDQLETEDQIGTLFAVQEILAQARQVRPEWSKITAEIMSLEGVTQGLRFETVSIDPKGTVLISGSVSELKNLSVLINRLRTRPSYEGPFVPNVTGVRGDFSFQIQFSYVNL